MKKYRIITPYGTEYEIDEDGCFLRYGEHAWEHPHDTWKCRGCAEIRPFGNLRCIGLPAFLAMIEDGNTMWTFKNGNPRYTIIDLDHGTRRAWGNTKYHGIRTAYAI